MTRTDVGCAALSSDSCRRAGVMIAGIGQPDTSGGGSDPELAQ